MLRNGALLAPLKIDYVVTLSEKNCSGKSNVNELNTKYTLQKKKGCEIIITLDDCNKMGERWADQVDEIKFFIIKRVSFVVKKFRRFVSDCDVSFNHYIFAS